MKYSRPKLIMFAETNRKKKIYSVALSYKTETLSYFPMATIIL